MMFVTISKKEELLKYEGDIRQLFEAAFGKKISSDFWRWAYIDIPGGNPIVSLYFEKGCLLGHYGAVPIRMRCEENRLVAYRSMTSMVHPEGQGKGLFVELGRQCYLEMQNKGVPLVFGFPNLQALPGRKKHLGWTILNPDRVVDVSGSSILSNPDLFAAPPKEAEIHWDYEDQAQSIWRTNAPSMKYKVFPGLVLKEYEGVWNVLHLASEGLQHIHPTETYRVLIESKQLDQFSGNEASFDYIFGYRAFKSPFRNAVFRRELILSDVF